MDAIAVLVDAENTPIDIAALAISTTSILIPKACMAVPNTLTANHTVVRVAASPAKPIIKLPNVPSNALDTDVMARKNLAANLSI